MSEWIAHAPTEHDAAVRVTNRAPVSEPSVGMGFQTPGPAASKPGPSRIVMIGHNRHDSAFLRRVGMFIDAGVHLTTFTFRRDKAEITPDSRWIDIDLGTVQHAKLAGRALLYLRALRTFSYHRGTLQNAHVVHARNLDLYVLLALTLAVIAPDRRSSSVRKRVYEVLDVHFALSASSVLGSVLRWIERRVLSDADLLVTSSAGFVRDYFIPVQKLSLPWLLVENKLSKDVLGPSLDRVRREAAARDVARREAVMPPPLVIAWVGVIRCPVTLDLVIALANSHPVGVEVRITGLVSRFILTDFDERISDVPNIVLRGPFDYPAGLADAYRGADLCFAQDLRKSGENSAWLVPNRVYEAAIHAVPCVAVKGTETAGIVSERALGFVLSDPLHATFEKFIDSLEATELARARNLLLMTPPERFVSDLDEALSFVTACLRPETHASA